MAVKLDQTGIETHLQQLHADWSINQSRDHIQRCFSFEDYYQTLSFTNAVAWIAHRNNHHPELLIGYKTCQVDFSTHSLKGLSDLDFICAKAIDELDNI